MHIPILIATMTGTAEFVAEEIAAALTQKGHSAELVRMEDASCDFLATQSTALICSSSYGAGDVPDNGQALYAELERVRPDLAHLRFGVVALGNRTYSATFCGGAERFAALMTSLGAQLVGDLLRHDAQSDGFPEDCAVEWLDGWLSELAPA